MPATEIDTLFYQLAQAVDAAHAELEQFATSADTGDAIATPALDAMLAHAHTLVRHISALPASEAAHYHAALATVQSLLEELDTGIRQVRDGITQELQSLEKHQRAFTAYLKQPKT